MYKIITKNKWGLVIPVLTAFAFAALSGLSAKGKNYGAAGCGVGSLIFSAEENAKFSQIVAKLTNTTFSQTFSISSGTSNCYDNKSAYLEYRREEFAAVNYAVLKKEMAVGKGEKLEAFAALMGCNSSASFASMAQKNYDHFFAASVSKPAEFVNRVKTSMAADQSTVSACSA